MDKAAMKIPSRVRAGFAIVNPWGEFWSPEIFDSPEEAERHFRRFWASPGFEKEKTDWKKYRVVRARQTLTFTGAG